MRLGTQPDWGVKMHGMVQSEHDVRSSDEAAGAVAVFVPRLRGRNAVRAAAKRTIDAVGAAAALIVLSPLLALIAVLVVVDSPGPVFYRADRIGYRGKRL